MSTFMLLRRINAVKVYIKSINLKLILKKQFNRILTNHTV